MDLSALTVLASALTAGLFLVCYLIATDKRRFLVRFDLNMWRPSYYLRALPNFLQALHDNHFSIPWPARRNGLSAAYFQFRTRPLLKKRPPHLRRAFVQQHLTLFALLENLRPYLRDFILNEQQRIVGERIVNMEDTIERDRLIEFLDWVREERNRFHTSLCQYDRALLIAMVDQKVVPTLRRAHAIYQEHGFTLMPELTQLRRWEEMQGADLVQELPEVPARRDREKRISGRTRQAREIA